MLSLIAYLQVGLSCHGNQLIKCFVFTCRFCFVLRIHVYLL